MEEVERLVDDGLINEAVRKAQKISCPTADLWRIIQKQVGNRRYDRASRLIEDLQLGQNDSQSISDFILRALVDSQFAIALKWSVSLKGQRPNPQDCVAVAIQRDCIELAMKFIAEMNLEGFDIPQLIERLCQQENFTSARKYSQRFNLEEQFPPEVILERMFHAGQWDNALTLINQVPKLKSTFSGLAFLERIIRTRDWIASIKFAQQFGIPIHSNSAQPLNPAQRTIVRMMIEGMVRDAKLYQAMRLVFAHQFQDEYPPKQLIRTMIKERQYAHAIRFINALKLVDEFQGDVAKIQKERMRELAEFRKLMALRKKNSRTLLPSTSNGSKEIVAQLFLGSRTFVRMDGKLVLASACKTAGSEVETLSPSPTKYELQTADGDEDDEEIVFSSKPGAKVASAAINPGLQFMQQPVLPNEARAQVGYHPVPAGGHAAPPLHLLAQSRSGPFPPPGPMYGFVPGGVPSNFAPMQHTQFMPMPGHHFNGVPREMAGHMSQFPPSRFVPSTVMNMMPMPPQSHQVLASGHPEHAMPAAQVAGMHQQQQAQQHRQQTTQKQQEQSLAAEGKKGSQQSRKVIKPSQLF